MPDVDATLTAGVEARGYRSGSTTADSWNQYVVPVKDRVVSYVGRAGTFSTQGNAATANQYLLSIFNASATTTVAVNRITCDLLAIAAAGIAPTVQVPAVRVRRITAAPTGGTALTKVARDTGGSTDASVTVLGGTASDGGALTAITATPAAGFLAQKWAPRVLVVGTSASTFYEPVDTIPFFYGEPDITLRQNQGLVISLEGQVAAGNPTTFRWLAEIDWEEYTRP